MDSSLPKTHKKSIFIRFYHYQIPNYPTIVFWVAPILNYSNIADSKKKTKKTQKRIPHTQKPTKSVFSCDFTTIGPQIKLFQICILDGGQFEFVQYGLI